MWAQGHQESVLSDVRSVTAGAGTRNDILDDIGDAFETGPTHPDYTVLFIGVRGSGKTVMLNATEELARMRGWLTLSDNESPTGLLDRLAAAAAALLEGFEPPDPSRRVTGVSVAGFGVTVQRMSDDAVAVLQHVTRREQNPIAFAGASLPSIDDTLLSDDDIATFLQRCSRYDIDRIDDASATDAIAEPIFDRGGSIADADLERAVAATSGYAFMIQLVGFHTWKAASDPSAGISSDETSTGIAEAERRIGRLVFAPTWKGLSDVDRRFLLAMARDGDHSRLSTIADRLGVDTNYAGVYRHRLIRSGMITPTGKGLIDFAHHATRAWIRNEAAYAAISFPDDE